MLDADSTSSQSLKYISLKVALGAHNATLLAPQLHFFSLMMLFTNLTWNILPLGVFNLRLSRLTS